MTSWIKANAIALLMIVGVLAVQWFRFDAATVKVEQLQDRLDEHIRRTDLHIDPNRDARIQEELNRRLANVERDVREYLNELRRERQ